MPDEPRDLMAELQTSLAHLDSRNVTVRIQTDKWGTKTVIPGRDFQVWELGLEHIVQEGSPVWREIRERHGLSHFELESISSGEVMWEEATMAEDRPGVPTLEHLKWLALLEGKSVGALLDEVLIAKGREIAREDD
jgi:hypothetical protein